MPHVCFLYEADATELLKEYAKLSQSGKSKITFNTLLLRMLVEAVKSAPQVNAHIRYNRHTSAGRIDYLESVDISMPWLLDNGGMITVRLRDFGNKSLVDMAEYLEDMRRRVLNTNMELAMLEVSLWETRRLVEQGHFIKVLRRLYGAFLGKNRLRRFSKLEKKRHRDMPEKDGLTAGDLEQGSITVSNIGAATRGLGGAMTLLEIIPPQVFAIGISAMQDKVLAVDNVAGEKSVAVRKVIPFCLSFDHRALDFNDAAPFIRRLDELFRAPAIIHKW